MLADVVTYQLTLLFTSDDGTDNSDHEREWEKQQLQKGGASTKVSAASREILMIIP